MPTNYPARISGWLPLLEGGAAPNKTSNAYQQWESQLLCPITLPIIGVAHDPIACIIDHYVPVSEVAPVEGALIYYSGQFQVRKEEGDFKVYIKTLRLR
ncbi:MAG: hypothetical protein M1823_005978, partial [Watsoniomyces obsoletus]